MKKYFIFLGIAALFMTLVIKQVSAENVREEIDDDRQNVRISPSPFWKNEDDRRNEFLSKTPDERRLMRQVVRQKKLTITPTPTGPLVTSTPQETITAQPTLVQRQVHLNMLDSLWNGFWGLFRKQATK